VRKVCLMHIPPILLETASDTAYQWHCSNSYSCQRLVWIGIEFVARAAWIILESILEHWH